MKLPLCRVLFSVVLLWSALTVYAQTPDTLWTRTFGGTADDAAWCVQPLPGGGYVLAGYTHSFGAGLADAWLIRTDPLGGQVWAQTYGGGFSDLGRSVEPTSDGGFILAGQTYSQGAGEADVLLIKTDAAGNQLWMRTFGGTEHDAGYTVQQTTDGGYIVAAMTTSFGAGQEDVWLIKTDSAGNEEWNQTFGGPEANITYCARQTADGGYVITGWKDDPVNQFDLWLIKVDPTGTEEWNRTWGSAQEDWGYSVEPTTDGGFAVIGWTDSFGAGQNDLWLVRMDCLGDTLWTRTFGGSGEDYGRHLRQTDDGGFILIGYTNSSGAGGWDAWVIKTDSIGVQEWALILGGPGDDYGLSIQPEGEDRYIAAGCSQCLGLGGADAWLLCIGKPRLRAAAEPLNPPVIIPAEGGNFDFTLTIANTTDSSVTFDAWTKAVLPNGSPYGPIILRQNLTLAAGDSLARQFTQSIGSSAPTGQYQYNLYTGRYPDTCWARDGFTFEKEGVRIQDSGFGDGGIWMWVENDWSDNLDLAEFGGTRSVASLSGSETISTTIISPNPFNHTTSFSYQLSASSHVTLKVYDTAGRLVVTLVDGWRGTGDQGVTLDGSGLAAGIYLYQLQVSGSGETLTTLTGKMVLLK
jgi:hypothetical protein